MFPEPLNNDTVAEIGGVSGEYVSQDRVVADQGRVAEPARINEIMLTADAARLLGWHVGQVIPMGAFTFAQATAGGPPTTPPFLVIQAKVVGIVALSTTVARDEVDRYPAPVIFTPAFTNKLIASGAARFATYDFRLDRGARDVAAVEQEIVANLPSSGTYNFHVTPVVEGQVEQAIKPESISLAAFGVIALLAAAVIGAQAIIRAVRANAESSEFCAPSAPIRR
ncbi:MAG: hypothetical protein ACRDJU_14715 [Actinomycetota bacterium]